MALFDSNFSTEKYDESCLLLANISDVKNRGSYTEYSITVCRSCSFKSTWVIVCRYRDLAELHGQLDKYGLQLNFPPKKWIGNMDPDFVQQRTLALQAFIDGVLKNLNIAACPVVQRFFCRNSNPLLDLQNRTPLISMSLRSLHTWNFVEPWPNIGWRLRKCYGIVKKTTDANSKAMLCWSFFGPDRVLEPETIKQILLYYAQLRHPFILPLLESSVNADGAMTIRRLMEQGSLRDLLTKKKPKHHFVSKYAAPFTDDIELTLDDYRLIGRQILEALMFLHKRGLPYGALHAGNVFIAADGTCQLSGLENAVFGLPSMYRAFAVQCKAVKTLPQLDIYCFGHLLAEMCGFRLYAPFADARAFALLGPYIGSILSTLLSEEATASQLPTAMDLIGLEFFAVRMPTIPLDKVPSRLKPLFGDVHKAAEERLLTDRKQHLQNQQLRKVESFINSASEREKRKQSSKAWVDQMQSVRQSETLAKQTLLNQNLQVDIPSCSSTPGGPDAKETGSTGSANGGASDANCDTMGRLVVQPTPASLSPTSPPPPPPPPVSPMSTVSPVSPALPSPVGNGCSGGAGDRGALLSSIRSFRSAELRKTETVDKSKLKVG